jgi:hypothetical protein
MHYTQTASSQTGIFCFVGGIGELACGETVILISLLYTNSIQHNTQVVALIYKHVNV